MLFRNEESSLKLDVVNYEFPADAGAPGSDDRNWLVLRCTWQREDGLILKDSVSCLLTFELQEMTAGLKVLNAGIKTYYETDFSEPYFSLAAALTDRDTIVMGVSFYMPNTMADEDTAEIECEMTHAEMKELIAELDKYCAKFPDRK